jgi:DNA-binding MarR family transcriptional regulator
MDRDATTPGPRTVRRVGDYTLETWLVLEYLVRVGSGFPAEIAGEVGLTSNTVGSILARLKRASVLEGWHDRRKSPRSTRGLRHYYRFTEPGRAAAEEYVERHRSRARIASPAAAAAGLDVGRMLSDLSGVHGITADMLPVWRRVNQALRSVIGYDPATSPAFAYLEALAVRLNAAASAEPGDADR